MMHERMEFNEVSLVGKPGVVNKVGNASSVISARQN